MTTKQSALKRQAAIKELIQKWHVKDQKHLVELLHEYFQITANQTVVSRDLRKMGVVKKVIREELTYVMPENDVTTDILKLALLEISHNESLIVIKTHPGLAAFVGDFIDQNSGSDILGCLAGENVVFITPKSIKDIASIYKNVCQILHFRDKNDQKNN